MQAALTALLAGRRGHFQTESGYHTDQWFDLDRLLADRARLRPFVLALAQRLAPHHLDAVCGPETGGARLAEMIAAELHLEAFAIERIATPGATGLFPIKYRIPSAARSRLGGRRVALVDDAISAGSAIRGTHTDLLAVGAQPVVLGALFVFGENAARFATTHHLALAAIAMLPAPLWPPTECPLCRAGQPVERVADAPPAL